MGWAELSAEERLDGESTGSFAGTLEHRILAEAGAGRTADVPCFDVLLYADEAGSIFRATTDLVGAIAYGIVEMKDRRARVAIQEALRTRWSRRRRSGRPVQPRHLPRRGEEAIGIDDGGEEAEAREGFACRGEADRRRKEGEDGNVCRRLKEEAFQRERGGGPQERHNGQEGPCEESRVQDGPSFQESHGQRADGRENSLSQERSCQKDDISGEGRWQEGSTSGELREAQDDADLQASPELREAQDDADLQASPELHEAEDDAGSQAGHGQEGHHSPEGLPSAERGVQGHRTPEKGSGQEDRESQKRSYIEASGLEQRQRNEAERQEPPPVNAKKPPPEADRSFTAPGIRNDGVSARQRCGALAMGPRWYPAA